MNLLICYHNLMLHFKTMRYNFQIKAVCAQTNNLTPCVFVGNHVLPAILGHIVFINDQICNSLNRDIRKFRWQSDVFRLWSVVLILLNFKHYCCHMCNLSLVCIPVEEYPPITHIWFAAELSVRLDNMGNVISDDFVKSALVMRFAIAISLNPTIQTPEISWKCYPSLRLWSWIKWIWYKYQAE